MAHVLDVAKYILEREGGQLRIWKFQKLVYYSQAWHVVWEETPLFDSRIEARIYGPTIPELYLHHTGGFVVSADMFPGDSSRLTSNEKESVNAVLDAYGHLSGQELIDLSQSERPWREARKDVPHGARSNNEIAHEAMRSFYGFWSSDPSV